MPFDYETAGKVTQYSSLLDRNPRSQEVVTFYPPEELRRLVDLKSQELTTHNTHGQG